MANNPLYTIFPYVAFALLVVGILGRYAMASRQPSVLAEELKDAKAVYGGRLFWVSMFLLLAGHLAGLLFPGGILSWNSSTGGLYLLEGIGLVAGLAGVGSGAVLIWRHLGHSSRSRLTETLDTVFLAILFTVLVSGVWIAVFYRWGSSWGAMTLSPYGASLVRGQPAAQYVTEMPSVVQLHVLASFAAIAILPLTRLSTFFVAGVHGSVALLSGPAQAALHAAKGFARKHDPSGWFWPEED